MQWIVFKDASIRRSCSGFFSIYMALPLFCLLYGLSSGLLCYFWNLVCNYLSWKIPSKWNCSWVDWKMHTWTSNPPWHHLISIIPLCSIFVKLLKQKTLCLPNPCSFNWENSKDQSYPGIILAWSIVGPWKGIHIRVCCSVDRSCNSVCHLLCRYKAPSSIPGMCN